MLGHKNRKLITGAGHRRNPLGRRAGFRPRVETLEARRMLAADAISSQFFSGTVSNVDPVQQFSINALAGDRLVVETYADGSYAPQPALRGPGNQLLSTGVNRWAGDNGVSIISHVIAPVDGTYQVDVSRQFVDTDFQVRVDTIRGAEAESESKSQSNNSSSAADDLSFDMDGALLTSTSSVGGAIYSGDVDYFSLGYVPAGVDVQIDASDLPVGTTLLPSVSWVGDGLVDTNDDPSIVAGTTTVGGVRHFAVRSQQRVDGASVYEYNSTPLGWGDARDAAIATGKDLASLETIELTNSVGAEFSYDNFNFAWIGINDADGDSTFQWSDGTSLTETAWLSTPHAPYGAVKSKSSGLGWTALSGDELLASVTERPALPGDAGLTGSGIAATYVVDIELSGFPSPQLVGTSPSLADAGPINQFFDQIDLFFNAELDPSTFDDSDVTLTNVGSDGVFGNSDDIEVLLTSSYSVSQASPSITLRSIDGLLAAGNYQLVVDGMINDVFGRLVDVDGDDVPGGIWTQDFTIAHDPNVTLESSDNDAIGGATELLIEADPLGGSWSRSKTGVGVLSSSSDQDYWKIDLNAGEWITVDLDRQGFGSASYNLYRQTSPTTVTSSLANGTSLDAFEVDTTGTYLFRVTGADKAIYGLNVAINDQFGIVNPGSFSDAIPSVITGNQLEMSLATVFESPGDQDRYELGRFVVGDQIEIELTDIPAWSPADPEIVITGPGSDLLDDNPNDDLFTATVIEDGTYRLQLSQTPPSPTEASTGSIHHQLAASITITDNSPLMVQDATPVVDDGGTLTSLLSNLSFEFNEPSSPANITSFIDVRSSGPDGDFDTGDDVTYLLQLDTFHFSSPNESKYFLPDGPLSDGDYRITLSATLNDRFGNALDGNGDGSGGDDWVRHFTIDAIGDGEMFEGLDNDTVQTATPLTLTPEPGGTGWYQSLVVRGDESGAIDKDWFSFTSTGNQTFALGWQGDANASASLYRHNGGSSVSFLGSSTYQNLPAGNYAVRISPSSELDYRFVASLISDADIPSNYGSSNSSNPTTTLDLESNSQTGEVTGAGASLLHVGSVNDRYAIGTVAQGSTIRVDLTKAAAVDVVMQVQVVDENGMVMLDTNPAPEIAEVPVDAFGEFFVEVSTAEIFYDSKSYEIVSGQVTQPEAKALAASRGGQLPTVDNAELNAFLRVQYGQPGFYLGLELPAVNDQWLDGTLIDYMNYGGSGGPFVSMSTFSSWRRQFLNTQVGATVIQSVVDPGQPSFAGNNVLSNYRFDVSILDITPPEFQSFQSLPSEGAVSLARKSSFRVNVNEAVSPGSLGTNSIVLDHAGADGVFDTADDLVYPIQQTADLDSSTSTDQHFIDVNFVDGYFLPGMNRVRVTNALTDLSANPMTVPPESMGSIDGDGIVAQRIFNVIDHRGEVVPEAIGETSHLQAPDLPFFVDRDGTHWSKSAIGVGRTNSPSDVDWFRFEADVDDWVDVVREGSTSSTTLNLYHVVDGVLTELPWDNESELSNLESRGSSALPATGTYYVSVESGTVEDYDMRLYRVRGNQVETESLENGRLTGAHLVGYLADGAVRRGSISGTMSPIATVSFDKDWYSLGNVVAGEAVIVSVNQAEWSPFDTLVQLRTAGGTVLGTTNFSSGTVIEHLATDSGPLYLRVRNIANLSGVDSQYGMNVLIADNEVSVPTPAEIASTSFNGGSATRSALTQVSVTFDSVIDLDPSQLVLMSPTTNLRVRSLTVSTEQIGSQTVATIGFQGGEGVRVGAGASSPTLQDGNYSIRYRGDGFVPSSQAADSFYAKYGDTDGDQSVSLTDFAAFRGVFGEASEGNPIADSLDANRDGIISLTDFASFRGNFGT